MGQAETAAARIGAHLQGIVAERGITIRDLADATGIPHSTLHRRLQGHDSFTINELERITAHLSLDILAVLAVAA